MIDLKKLHKIRGVEKTVCTAEQKIAYNMLFNAHINGTIKQKDFYLRHFKSLYPELLAKYNGGVIIALVSAHWEKYMDGVHIFGSYESLGKFLNLEVLDDEKI